jgi:AcrR family transcriptional regulator
MRVTRAVALRDPAARRSRVDILDSAMRLFTSRGYIDTSMSQVAKGAHVSKGLVFWHFESKEQLFRVALERTLEPYVIDVLDELDGLSEVTQLRRLIHSYDSFISRHLASVKFLLGVVLRRRPEGFVHRLVELHTAYRDVLVTVLEAGREKRLFAARLQPTVQASLIMAALEGLLLEALVGHGDASRSDALLSHLTRRLVDEQT